MYHRPLCEVLSRIFDSTLKYKPATLSESVKFPDTLTQIIMSFLGEKGGN